MTRAAIYTRVSEAYADEDSRADQGRRCRAFADVKSWDVTQVFTDRGISAWSGADRPGWTALETAVARGEFDAVLVFQVGRSARNATGTSGSAESRLDATSSMGSCLPAKLAFAPREDPLCNADDDRHGQDDERGDHLD
jgi:DNA invertase Pin-like site-specific DNA recombinase